jgi:TolB protein
MSLAEIWVMNADGTNPQRLTFNSLEERSPDWSPDGTKIMYMCRLVPLTPFEICVMNSDGTGGVEVLTNNTVPDLTPGWSPDGTRISFFRGLNGQEQIYVMNYLADENGDRHEEVLTAPPTTAFFPNWGTIVVGCGRS